MRSPFCTAMGEEEEGERWRTGMGWEPQSPEERSGAWLIL